MGIVCVSGCRSSAASRGLVPSRALYTVADLHRKEAQVIEPSEVDTVGNRAACFALFQCHLVGRDVAH